MHSHSGLVPVQQCWSKLHNLIGVSTVSNKALSNLGCRRALVAAACTGLHALCLQQCWSELQNIAGLSAVSNNARYNLGCRAALLQGACTGVQGPFVTTQSASSVAVPLRITATGRFCLFDQIEGHSNIWDSTVCAYITRDRHFNFNDSLTAR